MMVVRDVPMAALPAASGAIYDYVVESASAAAITIRCLCFCFYLTWSSALLVQLPPKSSGGAVRIRRDLIITHR